jgi:hypothetical protein
MIKRGMPINNAGEVDELGNPVRNEQRGNLLEDVVNSAANSAADFLSQKRPRFSKQFILRYMDHKAVTDYAKKVAPYLQEGKISSEEADNYLASHIVSGDFLTDEGKEIILESSLEKEAKKWGGWTSGARKAKNALEGEKYLDKAMIAFKDIYDLIQSDERYAKHMPELSQAVNALYELGFRDVTLTALRKHLPKDKYIAAKLGIAQAAEKAGEYANAAVRNYIPQGLAAAVLAIVGIGVLVTTYNLTGNTLTGNVIGTTNNSSAAAVIFGLVSFILGIYLFIRKK